MLISTPGAQQTAGRAVSLLGAKRLRGLTCPAAPAGVEHLPFQSTLCQKSTVSFNTAVYNK